VFPFEQLQLQIKPVSQSMTFFNQNERTGCKTSSSQNTSELCAFTSPFCCFLVRPGTKVWWGKVHICCPKERRETNDR